MEKKISVSGGVFGGIIGGVVFGMLMGMMGMLSTIAMLVNSELVVVGLLVHMTVSILTGIAFAYIFGGKIATVGEGTKWGLLYGFVWWFLGPLMFMPLVLQGSMMLNIDGMIASMPALMGHLIFGGILGAYYGRTVAKTE